MPTEPVRVLVVDDSPTVRSTIVSVLSAEPRIRVVGTATDGETAIDAVDLLAPDVVTLDLDMPRLDGHGFLRRVRPKHPRLPIIVFSHLTQRGAVATIRALFQGATDYVGKPSNTGSIDASRLYVKTELIPKILAFCTDGSDAPAAAPRPMGRQPSTPAPEIVVVGSSTGGPAAIDEIIRALPRGFPLPVVIVQHMPASFVPLLAERISTRSHLPVLEARRGDAVGPGRVLIAPGDRHLVLHRDGSAVTVETNGGPPVNGCCPSVDVLFKSAARTYGNGVLGVVLTGMGQDGLEGSQKIVEAGGRVLVQDQNSSVVWGMPGRVARAGLAEAIVPLKEIGGELALRARQGQARAAANSG